MSFMRPTRVLVVNILVLLGLFGSIEGFFRILVEENNSSQGVHWQTFRPFVMFSTPQAPSKTWWWDDQYHGQRIKAEISNNLYGFAMQEPVSLSRIRAKAENERVVLLTGGSAMWGVGASSDATSIAGQLEEKLNGAQNHFRYKVLNLAMGGWTAFQQFIALAMYGHNLQPDWIVTMDGFNDGAVACAHSQGAGYPLYYGGMEALFQGYLFAQKKPTFYRGRFENELIKYSKAYRVLTGKQYIDVNVKLDTSQDNVTKFVVRDANWGDLEDQLVFYVNVQQRLIDDFPNARILLSTQPVGDNFSDAFARIYDAYDTDSEGVARKQLMWRLDVTQRNHGKDECNTRIWKSARDYFLGKAALGIDSLVQNNRKTGKAVFYVNAGIVFPAHLEERRDFFIDSVHLNDAGMERVAQLYARFILAEDLPMRFTPVIWRGPKADRELFRAGGWSVPWIEAESLIATYGGSCKGFAPPKGNNNVYEGNATDFVLRNCSRTEGSCEIRVNVQEIGDPANSCGKDFFVSWRCLGSKETREAHVPAEANEKVVGISCK